MMFHFAIGNFNQYISITKKGEQFVASIERPTLEDSWYNCPLPSIGNIFKSQVVVTWNPYESTVRVDWLPIVIF